VTDRTNNDLAALLTPAPSRGVQFSQGKILAWDHEFLRNQIEWRGITLTDIPVVEGVNALALKEGDIVGMLGWAPENAQGVGTWWILGKLSNPGEFISDLTFFLGQVRFRTLGNEYDQVYFGQTAGNGLPLTVLYYGDAASTRALQIYGTNVIEIKDTSNNVIFANDSQSGAGIARPYFTYRLIPAFSAESSGTGNASLWPSTANVGFTDMLVGNNPMWHPRLTIGVSVSTVGGGAAEWAFSYNGATLHQQTGSGTATVSIPGWGDTVNPGNIGTLRIAGRCTGGATRTWFQCDRLHGMQS
jgi:hypothetical protein